MKTFLFLLLSFLLIGNSFASCEGFYIEKRDVVIFRGINATDQLESFLNNNSVYNIQIIDLGLKSYLVNYSHSVCIELH